MQHITAGGFCQVLTSLGAQEWCQFIFTAGDGVVARKFELTPFPLGMKVREINPRNLRNLDRLIAAGTLPEGRPVGELLMHYDTKSEQFLPDANAAFLFITSRR